MNSRDGLDYLVDAAQILGALAALFAIGLAELSRRAAAKAQATADTARQEAIEQSDLDRRAMFYTGIALDVLKMMERITESNRENAGRIYTLMELIPHRGMAAIPDVLQSAKHQHVDRIRNLVSNRTAIREDLQLFVTRLANDPATALAASVN